MESNLNYYIIKNILLNSNKLKNNFIKCAKIIRFTLPLIVMDHLCTYI